MASRARRAKSSAEQPFHILVADYLALALPAHAVWTTFPAGGGGRIRGGILKRMGLMPGWPDIQILVRNTSYDAARSMSRFIGLECKRAKGGTVSAAQIAAHKLIRNAGGEVYVVRALDEVYEALTINEGLNLKAMPSIALTPPWALNNKAVKQGSQK
jgi:hypothetical protein